MVAPASHRISRVRRYSRICPHPRPPASPTGLSPAPVGPFQWPFGCTTDARRARSVAPSSALVQPRIRQRRPARTPTRVWAPPRSLAATQGILSFPRGTEMFQFPRCPPRPCGRVTRLTRAGCPIRRSPDHRAASASPGHFAAWPRPSSAAGAKASTVRPSSSDLILIAMPALARRSRHRSRRTALAHVGTPSLAMRCRSVALAPVRRLSSCSGGAAGTRTPDLRRAKAALSQLSYDPSRPSPALAPVGGRAWTRTRDLGLIRAAL